MGIPLISTLARQKLLYFWDLCKPGLQRKIQNSQVQAVKETTENQSWLRKQLKLFGYLEHFDIRQEDAEFVVCTAVFQSCFGLVFLHYVLDSNVFPRHYMLEVWYLAFDFEFIGNTVERLSEPQKTLWSLEFQTSWECDWIWGLRGWTKTILQYITSSFWETLTPLPVDCRINTMLNLWSSKPPN